MNHNISHQFYLRERTLDKMNLYHPLIHKLTLFRYKQAFPKRQKLYSAFIEDLTKIKSHLWILRSSDERKFEEVSESYKTYLNQFISKCKNEDSKDKSTWKRIKHFLMLNINIDEFISLIEVDLIQFLDNMEMTYNEYIQRELSHDYEKPYYKSRTNSKREIISPKDKAIISSYLA
jgi:hypothetical protein